MSSNPLPKTAKSASKIPLATSAFEPKASPAAAPAATSTAAKPAPVTSAPADTKPAHAAQPTVATTVPEAAAPQAPKAQVAKTQVAKTQVAATKVDTPAAPKVTKSRGIKSKPRAAKVAKSTAKTMKESQGYLAGPIVSYEKFLAAALEFNAIALRGGEAVYKKAYENYVSNIADCFESAKALNKASNPYEAYNICAANCNKATGTLTEQYKAMSKLVKKTAKDTSDAALAVYAKSFA